MIIVLIFTCTVIYKINQSLSNLEYRQNALCYNMYLLKRQIKEDEMMLLK